jgi:hypothetical protein
VEIPRKKTFSWSDRFEPVTSRMQSGALYTWPQHLVVGCFDGGDVVVLFSGCSLFRKLNPVVSIDIVWIFLDFDCFTNEKDFWNSVTVISVQLDRQIRTKYFSFKKKICLPATDITTVDTSPQVIQYLVLGAIFVSNLPHACELVSINVSLFLLALCGVVRKQDTRLRLVLISTTKISVSSEKYSEIIDH